MAAFRCQICFEEQTQRLSLPQLSTINGDKFRGKDCGHPICQGCMAAYIVARVEEQRVFGIRCPAEGCKHEVHEQDVQNLLTRGLLSSKIAERFANLRKQNYSKRANDLYEVCVTQTSQEDLGLLKTLWKSTRLCPRCSLVIQRSQGCNSFGCICGHRFDYSAAPRVCGEGIDSFDMIIDRAIKLQLPLAAVVQLSKICRAIRNRAKIKSLAKSMDISYADAERHYDLQSKAFHRDAAAMQALKEARRERAMSKKVGRIAVALGLSWGEVQSLFERANNGDESAWYTIRQGRHASCGAVDDFKEVEAAALQPVDHVDE